MTHPIKKILAVLAIGNFFLSPHVSAAVYKCKSADGKMSFQATPCKKSQKSINTRIGGDSTNSSRPDSASIYGTWININDENSRMIISSSGVVNFSSPENTGLVGSLSKVGDNKYHVKASLEDFDLSSELTHNLKTGMVTLKMGSSVTSRFKKQ